MAPSSHESRVSVRTPAATYDQDDNEYGEIKRMYVRPAFRGQGLGRRILGHLTRHATSRGITLLRLETGIHQQEAIALYERQGFHRIPPFGAYANDPLTLCCEKQVG